MLKYIDVSKWQGNIDFLKLQSEINGVIIRAGYGKNTIDPYFKKNIETCNKYGIPCGVYWFSYAKTVAEAQQEAKYCLAAIEKYKIELPVCFDFEGESKTNAEKQGVNVTKILVSNIMAAFCEVVENAGYYAMIYANEDFAKNYMTEDVLARYDLWYARYLKRPNLNTPSRSCGMWQYTSEGSIAGITGNVDINAVYKDYKAIIAKAGLNKLQSQSKAWYADAQAWAVERGISDGTDPTGAATRAQVWAMLYRLQGGN